VRWALLRHQIKGKRINVHTRTRTKKTLGNAEQWPITSTLWGSALPFKPLIVDWQQSQSSAQLWKLTFGGEKDFSVADTRFSRGNYIWEPISISFIHSDSIGPEFDTLVECQRIDKLI